MLEPAGNLALCLARDGVTRAVRIEETADQLLVAWDSVYNMTDAAFTVIDIEKSASVRAIFGYPTGQILQMIEKMQELGAK